MAVQLQLRTLGTTQAKLDGTRIRGADQVSQAELNATLEQLIAGWAFA